jgi:hypothetical protein
MTLSDVMKRIKAGGMARRPCWQPGRIEQGIFQDKPTIYYCNPTDVMVGDHLMPAMRVTWTPIRVLKTDPRTGRQYLYPEDELATDWEVVK